MISKNWLTLGIALLSSLLGVGCGGGGGGAGGSSGLTARGTVILPVGDKTPLTSLKVMTGAGTAPVAANGSFTAQMPVGGPGLAQVVDASGKAVMTGFVDPADGPSLNILSSVSTAVALEFYNLGAFMLPANQYSHTLSLIRNDSSLKVLASTVQARISANPEALSNGDAQIVSAVSTASQAMLPGLARSGYESSAANAAKTIAAYARPQSGGDTGETVPDNIEIKPYDASVEGKSGITLVGSSDGTGVVAMNNLRRESRFYLFETYYLDSNNQKQAKFKQIDLNPDKKDKKTVSDSSMEVPETVALGGTPELLNDVFTKKVPWAPTSTSTMATPAENSTAKKTEYVGVDVGPLPFWLTGKLSPLIWTDALFESYQQPWSTDIAWESLITFVRGIVMPLILSVTELYTSAPSEATIQAEATEIAQAVETKIPDALSEVEAGNVAKPMGEIIEAIKNDEQFVEEIVHDLVAGAPRSRLAPQKLNPLEAAAVAALSTFSASSRLMAAFDSFFRLVDMAAVIKDNLTAYPVEGWIIDVVPPTVRLQPSTVNVATGQTSGPMDVTTSVDQSTLGKSTLAFVWTSTGQYGTIQDSLGNKGTTTITSIPAAAPYRVSLTYTAKSTAVSGNSDTITVKAYEKPEGSSNDPSSWISIGTAQSVVTVVDTYTLSGPGGGSFRVDDDLGVWLNGNVISYDPRGAYSGARGPFAFGGKSGDKLRIQVQDWYGFYAGIYDNVYLTTPSGSTTLLITAFTDKTAAGNQQIVYDHTFTLP